MKKYEFQGKNYHEECFLCKSCMQPIGVKTFIPKDNQPICVPCYEEKFAQKCVHCTKVGVALMGLLYAFGMNLILNIKKLLNPF